jgi:hypothetical protein
MIPAQLAPVYCKGKCKVNKSVTLDALDLLDLLLIRFDRVRVSGQIVLVSALEADTQTGRNCIRGEGVYA